MVKEKIFTNCFLVRTDSEDMPTEVCLAMKKRGFGKGMWNGAGGKPEVGESIEMAARREVEEEFDVYITDMDKKAEIEFILLREDKKVTMYAFLVNNWEGEPVETEEMKPKWFKIGEVPYDRMWKSDSEWLPLILSGKKIKAKYTYTQEGGEVETRQITKIDSF